MSSLTVLRIFGRSDPVASGTTTHLDVTVEIAPPILKIKGSYLR